MSSNITAADITAGLNETPSTDSPAPETPAAPAPQAPSAPAPQAPAAPAAPEPAAAPDPAAGAGPWAKDLEALGLGDLTSKVDGFLRSSIQPRMTELEQQLAETNKMFGGDPEMLQAASQMWQGFNTDPMAEFLRVGQHLGVFTIDDDGNVQFAGQGPEDDGEAAALTDQPDPRLEWIEQRMAAEEQEAQRKVVEDYIQQIGQQFGEGFNSKLYETLWVGASGNEAEALELYKLATGGGAPEQPAPTPPPVLNEGTGKAAEPPAAPPKNINDAMAEYMAEEKLRAAKK